MRKDELSGQLAREAGVSKPDAADQLDRIVHTILKNLKKGQPVALPGLGTFLPGEKPAFRFEDSFPPKRLRGRK